MTSQWFVATSWQINLLLRFEFRRLGFSWQELECLWMCVCSLCYWRTKLEILTQTKPLHRTLCLSLCLFNSRIFFSLLLSRCNSLHSLSFHFHLIASYAFRAYFIYDFHSFHYKQMLSQDAVKRQRKKDGVNDTCLIQQNKLYQLERQSEAFVLWR